MLPDRLREVREKLGWSIPVEELEEHLKVGRNAGTSAMTVEGSADSAEDARALTQALVDVFLARQLEFNAERLEEEIDRTRSALRGAEEELVQARANYDAFRKTSGKPDLIKEQELLLSRVTELRSKADAEAVEVVAQNAQIAELEKAQRELPKRIVERAAAGSVVDAPLARARAELVTARATLSEAHPKVLALKERVARLEAQRKRGGGGPVGERTLTANPARAAVERQLATARAALAAAQEKEAALRALAEEVKAEADSLAPSEGEARELVGDLKLTEGRVAELTEMLARLKDLAQNEATGFRILSEASLPELPDRSKVGILLLVALPILAMLIAALWLIGRELRDLDVQTPTEVAWWGRGPVLGTSVWPRNPAALGDFVDEMEDHGVHGAGRTLVVPASERERELAATLSMRLAAAPWLAAAILDVEEGIWDRRLQAGRGGSRADAEQPLTTPAPPHRVARLSSEYPPTPTTTHPAPPSPGSSPQVGTSSPPVRTPLRPNMPRRSPHPRKKTIVGLPVSSSPPGADSLSTAPRQRPPRKKTIVGLQPQTSSPPPLPMASESSSASPPPSETAPLPLVPPPAAVPSPSPTPPSEPAPTDAAPAETREAQEVPIPLGRPTVSPRVMQNISRAAVRMVVHAGEAAEQSEEVDDPVREQRTSHEEEEAFLLTRPAVVAGEAASTRVGRAVLVGEATSDAPVSTAVIRAAIRLLSEPGDATGERPRGQGFAERRVEEPTAVALAWNGPLSGPVLRRAARLAHRVMVVVSAGMNAIELSRVTTRLGRNAGVGYVLVNLDDAYVELEDRVGPVEAFWDGRPQTPARTPQT